MSQRYQALAIGFEDDKLFSSYDESNDLIAIDDLRILTGYEISPVVVSDKELISAIRKILVTVLTLSKKITLTILT